MPIASTGYNAAFKWRGQQPFLETPFFPTNQSANNRLATRSRTGFNFIGARPEENYDAGREADGWLTQANRSARYRLPLKLSRVRMRAMPRW
jgi:hypothetical protein